MIPNKDASDIFKYTTLHYFLNEWGIFLILNRRLEIETMANILVNLVNIDASVIINVNLSLGTTDDSCVEHITDKLNSPPTIN